MAKLDLTLAVFGRGRAVENSDGLFFSRLDYSLNKKLAKIFKRLVIIPIVYSKASSMHSTFTRFYDDNSVIDNAVIFPVYAHTCYTVKNRFLKKVLAWKSGTKAIVKAMRISDTALIYMPSVMGFIGIVVYLLLRKPYILYFGSDWGKPNPRTGGITHLTLTDKLILKAKSLVQATAYYVAPVILMRDRAIVERLSRKRKNVYYIPGSSPITKEHLYKRSDSCVGEEVTCLTVCSLNPLKGVADIIGAISALNQRKANIKLWHVGGSYPDSLERTKALCANLAVEKNVTFYGYTSDTEKLVQLYRKADIFILASHSEGFPRVIIEAMSQSLPVIATDITSIRSQLTDKHDCLLVKPADPNSISCAITSIINDSELRKRIIRNGYKLAEKELTGDTAAQCIIKAIRTYFPQLTGAVD